MKRVMYHGTVAAFVEAIKTHGLQPNPEHAWRVAWDNGEELRDHEKVDAVYLTSEERHAISYAETRVRYFEAQPGTSFQMFDQPGFFLTKDGGTSVLHTTPVLIVVETDDDDPHLEPDPRDWQSAYRYRGRIPPTRIVEIRELSPTLPEYTNTEEEDLF